MTSRSSNKKLTFLVYDKNKSPFYFIVKKKILKLLLFILPIVSVLSILALVFIAIYFKQIKVLVQRKEPAIIQDLRDKTLQLEADLNLEKEQTKILTQKLSSSSSSKYPALDLFKIPTGISDLRSKNLVSIENVQTKLVSNQIKVDYQITNNKTKKLAGYSFVILYQGNAIYLFPKNIVNPEDQVVQYSSGDRYATARFRPSQAVFETKKLSGRLKFVNFTRDGDLMSVHNHIIKEN